MTPKIASHFKKTDPKIFEVMRFVDYSRWLTPNESPGSDGYFRSLSRNIIGQQLSGKAAASIYKKFINIIGSPKYTPKHIADITHDKLRSAGLSNAKANYVRGLSEAMINKTLQLDKIDEMADKEVISHLTQIKGIGEWTAEMFLMFTLQRPDIFSHKDLGLKKGLAKVYEFDINEINEDLMNKITDLWRPYRTYGSIALWESLEDKPNP